MAWLARHRRASSKSGSAALSALADDIQRAGFTHVLLLGMGGSSLGPEVLAETFGRQNGGPELLVLDSTDPAQIRTIESKIDPARTLFIVSSKSGSTLEPNILKQYFFESRETELSAPTRRVRGSSPSPIRDRHCRRSPNAIGFRHIAYGIPSIGGRYSVLSDFGMVPAAAMGLDIGRLLGAAQMMVRSCGASAPPADNPGVVLGTILGDAGKGRPRQGHHRRLARHCRFRRVAGTASGRIDRQAGQGTHPGRRRAARPARRLREGSPVRLCAPIERSGCQAG